MIKFLIPFMVLHCNEAFVTLADPKMEILVEFYAQFLGIQPLNHIPHRYAEFQLPSLRLGIFQPKSSHVSEFYSQGKTGMSLCLEVQNLEEAIAHLQVLGYPPPGKIITASHGREIYAYDPMGNRLILYQIHASSSEN
ncbi:Glyoxalase/bleomycin resistance protein/dioxygenase [Planktothrix serta PCC 8927]|uniref:Glyoxalase/bleomycin resistance protein/dioxygenase n=2 Tax=Planktothrix TaxID=54304 RepID=A0A7Z9BNX9_9CYAN|nr:Glyoxalase/bleomycin resistance protein/dioxygenase [Planktothrix serta PCC 8927]